MYAVIMAGGKGARLLPHTELVPKPMLTIGNRPILEILLLQLRKHNIRDIILVVGHMAQHIRQKIGDGRQFDLNISYVEESTPLGTCGALADISDALGSDFILANGDLLTDLDISKMVEAHFQRCAEATVGSFCLTERIPYGVLNINPDFSVRTYDEKPQRTVEVSMGIYVLHTEAIRTFLKKGVPFDMPELISGMIEAGKAVFAFNETRFWMDIGTPSDYSRANEYLINNRHFLDEHT
jgi:NDP-mannose synthase